ncbi:hypothetical protein [Nostoc sp.]|uniref:hypothetical protein n=1 Tax=Nostoc sp. TaxID=1180 RepID=UPI002FF95BD0
MSVTGWYLFGNTFIGVIKKAIALTLSIQMYYVTLQSLLFYKKDLSILTNLPGANKMGFTEEIAKLSEQVRKRADQVVGEEATKMALIVPFLTAVGYDVYDPSEVMPEYVADFAIRHHVKISCTKFIWNSLLNLTFIQKLFRLFLHKSLEDQGSLKK